MTFLIEAKRSTKSDQSLDKDLATAETEAMTRKWQSTLSKEGKEFISRILSSSKAKQEFLWILRAAEKWAEKDEDRLCSVTYPLVAKIADARKDPAAVKVVHDRVALAMNEKWPDLLEEDAACAQSWLDLETHVLDTEALQKKYTERTDWKLTGPWLERIWQHSEQLEKMGHHDDARKLWTRIAAEGTPDSFEVKMAKTRLDPTKTEFETLWK